VLLTDSRRDFSKGGQFDRRFGPQSDKTSCQTSPHWQYIASGVSIQDTGGGLRLRGKPVWSGDGEEETAEGEESTRCGDIITDKLPPSSFSDRSLATTAALPHNKQSRHEKGNAQTVQPFSL